MKMVIMRSIHDQLPFANHHVELTDVGQWLEQAIRRVLNTGLGYPVQ